MLQLAIFPRSGILGVFLSNAGVLFRIWTEASMGYNLT